VYLDQQIGVRWHNKKQDRRMKQNRRTFTACVAAIGSAAFGHTAEASKEEFRLKYMLASCLFGYQYLGEILPQVRLTGATAIDIWPKVHGNQREQIDDLGEARFLEMLAEHEVQLGCLTQYKLGPFGLTEELELAKRLGCGTIVTGGKGPKGLSGSALKSAVQSFVEAMKPHLAKAEECGVRIAIENHANNLIFSPDSMRWLMDLSPSENLGIAFAPYHLPQQESDLSKLIRQLGNRIAVFYGWQHGMGCMTKLPKEQELLQLPGRGELDFAPLIAALKDIQFDGWTEIFMHPVPRGIPILPTAKEVTDEVNRSRQYLESLI
jgi:sugar phosphate isomerase/epimerase